MANQLACIARAERFPIKRARFHAVVVFTGARNPLIARNVDTRPGDTSQSVRERCKNDNCYVIRFNNV